MLYTKRHNVTVHGETGRPILFAHGFGCDQIMWRFVWPAFTSQHRVVLFDHIGAGKSDISTYDANVYNSLDRYADDILGIVSELGLEKPIFVGHSVSAMIGVLAAAKAPDCFEKLVLIGPSPCYLNLHEYAGGFDREAIEGMLDLLDQNYVGWAQAMAPVIMGRLDQPQLGQELTESFCRTDATIARQFARVTFLSDNRADLARVSVPSLILQCANDAIAPSFVGEYMQRHLANSTLVHMQATGHCPNLSAPDETIAAIKAFLR